MIRAFYLYFFLSRRQETFDVYYFFAFRCTIKIIIKLLKSIVRGESWKKSTRNEIFVRDTESPSFDPFIRSRLFLVARFSSWKIEEKMQERLKNWKLVASIFETRHLHSFVLIELWIVNWTLRIIDFYRYVPLLKPNVLALNTVITQLGFGNFFNFIRSTIYTKFVISIGIRNLSFKKIRDILPWRRRRSI